MPSDSRSDRLTLQSLGSCSHGREATISGSELKAATFHHIVLNHHGHGASGLTRARAPNISTQQRCLIPSAHRKDREVLAVVRTAMRTARALAHRLAKAQAAGACHLHRGSAHSIDDASTRYRMMSRRCCRVAVRKGLQGSPSAHNTQFGIRNGGSARKHVRTEAHSCKSSRRCSNVQGSTKTPCHSPRERGFKDTERASKLGPSVQRHSATGMLWFSSRTRTRLALLVADCASASKSSARTATYHQKHARLS